MGRRCTRLASVRWLRGLQAELHGEAVRAASALRAAASRTAEGQVFRGKLARQEFLAQASWQSWERTLGLCRAKAPAVTSRHGKAGFGSALLLVLGPLCLVSALNTSVAKHWSSRPQRQPLLQLCTPSARRV